jgi:hypothetical protein
MLLPDLGARGDDRVTRRGSFMVRDAAVGVEAEPLTASRTGPRLGTVDLPDDALNGRLGCEATADAFALAAIHLRSLRSACCLPVRCD